MEISGEEHVGLLESRSCCTYQERREWWIRPGSRSDYSEKWSNSGFIFRVELTGLVDLLI